MNYSKTTTSADGMVETEFRNANYDEKNHQFLDVWDSRENNWENSDFGGIYLRSIS